MIKALSILGGGFLLLMLFFTFAPVANNITAVANATTMGAVVTVANGTIIDTSGDNVAHFYWGYSNFMQAFALICFLGIIVYIAVLLWRHKTGQP
jgi:hypothetical protein